MYFSSKFGLDQTPRHTQHGSFCAVAVGAALLSGCGGPSESTAESEEAASSPAPISEVAKVSQQVVGAGAPEFIDGRGERWRRIRKVEFNGTPRSADVVEVAEDDEGTKPDYAAMTDAELVENMRTVMLIGEYEYERDLNVDELAQRYRKVLAQIESGELASSGAPSEVTTGPPEEELIGQASGIIGADNRTQKRNNTSFPWNAQLLLSGSQGGCSATMIGPSTAVSAAHCFKDANDNWLPDFNWAVGADSQDANPYPYGSYYGCYAVIVPATYDGSVSRDWAVIEFSYELYPSLCGYAPGDDGGYLGWAADFVPGSHYGYVYGYPGIQCPGVGDCNWPQIWGVGANNMDEDGDNIDHYADATDGTSGAGLYIFNASGVRTVVGAHSRAKGTYWYPYGWEYWNEARRIEGSFHISILTDSCAPGSVTGC